MKTVKERIDEFLKAKGYVHTEEHTETYKCQPYTKESVRYSKPKPDPNGESEYTHTTKEEIIDSISDSELVNVLALEHQNSLDTLVQTLDANQKHQAEQIKSISESVNVIKTIMLVFAALTAVNVIIAIMSVAKIMSAFS